MSPKSSNLEQAPLTPEQERITELEGQLAERDITIATQKETITEQKETIADQQEKIEELEKTAELALKNPVTKMLNQPGLEEIIKPLLSQRKEIDQTGKEIPRKPMTVLMLDIDDFKAVNDVYGHPEGDRILRETAKFLEGRVRPGDVVSHLHGEEFAIVFYNATEQDIFNAFYDKGEEKSRAGFPIPLGGIEDHRVTLSGGITMFKPEEDAKDLDKVLARADAALYASKNSPGKDRLTIFTDEIEKKYTAEKTAA